MSDQAYLALFEQTSGYKFKDPQLFIRAITHSSLARGTQGNNERLEFLGDRVLGLVVAEAIYQRYPDLCEGDMAHRLNQMVKRKTCAVVARRLKLDEILRAKSGKRAPELADSENVQGDVCEAVIAAIYCDGGLDEARKFIIHHWQAIFGTAEKARRDAKTSLQEWALGRKLAMPLYEVVVRSGPDHAPAFIMQVSVDGYESENGQGASKRAGEQQAATNFMRKHQIEHL